MEKEFIFRSESVKKIYFTTAEVAEIIGELQYTIRCWVKEFHIYREKKEKTKTWQYPRRSIAKLHVIKTLLRDEKFTIEGAKLKIKQNHAWANL